MQFIELNSAPQPTVLPFIGNVGPVCGQELSIDLKHVTMNVVVHCVMGIIVGSNLFRLVCSESS